MSGNRFEPQDWAEFLFEPVKDDQFQNDLERSIVTMEFGELADFQSHVEEIISDMHDAIGCEGADVRTDSMLAVCELRGDGSGLWEDREQHHATLRDMVHACPRVTAMLDRIGLDWTQQSVARYLGSLEWGRWEKSADAYAVYLANCRESGSLPHGS